MIAVGVDAAGGAWLAVVLADGAFADAGSFPRFADILAVLGRAAAIGVDVPIGLPEPGGRRETDLEARRLVGPRRSSVFFAPPRAALAAESYGEARLVEPSLSAQAYALRRAILEVEPHAGDERVHEVHPEVSFAALAGRALPWRKRSWNGQQLRRRLLAGAGIVLPDELPAGLAPADDLLDAAVAAWTAARVARGEAKPLPAGHRHRVGAIWR